MIYKVFVLPDNCESLCVHGRCVKDKGGNPSCFCDDGYQGLDCSDSAGKFKSNHSKLFTYWEIFFVKKYSHFWIYTKLLYLVLPIKTQI